MYDGDTAFSLLILALFVYLFVCGCAWQLFINHNYIFVHVVDKDGR